jgi:hypothetical protein
MLRSTFHQRRVFHLSPESSQPPAKKKLVHKTQQVVTSDLIKTTEKSAQTEYIPAKLTNRRVSEEIQCKLPPQEVHKPLCNRSRLCPQSKWLVKRLVHYNIKTKVRAPKEAAAVALGISKKTVTNCLKSDTIAIHRQCADDLDASHLPSCRIFRKRITRRELWARSIKQIDGLLADKIKRLMHDEFYRKCKTVSVSRLLAKLKEDMESDGGFRCSESNFRLVIIMILENNDTISFYDSGSYYADWAIDSGR